jgi:micrococcal nuclease
MRSGARHLLGLAAAVAFVASACSMSVASPGAASGTTATGRPAASPWATVKPAFAPTGPTEAAKVVRIVDGDTIVVAIGGKNYKLRYIGMDTPEDVKPDSPVEPMSREAAAANTRLVAGKTVVLEKDVSETDQYGRLLRYVWLHDGATWTLVNLVLVQQGYATALRYPPDVKYADLFESAQSGAESSRLGIWGLATTPAPTPLATPKATPRPTPRPTPKPTPRQTNAPASNCHPSYRPCLPIVSDLDCPDVRAMGLAPVQVIGPDDYRLDGDHDGWGCE